MYIYISREQSSTSSVTQHRLWCSFIFSFHFSGGRTSPVTKLHLPPRQQLHVAFGCPAAPAPQKMCLRCLMPYVLKNTRRIRVHRPRMKPSGGCQSFCFGF